MSVHAPLVRLEKAQRLVAEGRVHKIEDVEVFLVNGDSDDYTVTIAPNKERCECKSWKTEKRACKHIWACRELINQSRDPFRGIPSEEHPAGRPLRSV